MTMSRWAELSHWPLRPNVYKDRPSIPPEVLSVNRETIGHRLMQFQLAVALSSSKDQAARNSNSARFSASRKTGFGRCCFHLMEVVREANDADGDEIDRHHIIEQ